MANFSGPREKLERKYRETIFGRGKSLKKRSYGPGQHGRRRKNRSLYSIQLHEKQKVKLIYGLLERQFLKTFRESKKGPGLYGEKLLSNLELRLDNAVFRAGICRSRASARQFVSHGHLLVNGNKVNIPSYRLSFGDIISIRPKSNSAYSDIVFDSSCKWIEWDSKKKLGKVLRIPTRKDITDNIDETKIVELYSR